MATTKTRRNLALVALVLSIGVAIAGAVGMIGAVRVVDAVILFAGGFGAGAATRALIGQLRRG